jgi:hypothetical protein
MLDDREQSPRRRGGRSREEEDDQEQRREEQMDIVSGRLRSRQSAMKTSRLSPNRWPAGDRSILVDDIDLVQLWEPSLSDRLQPAIYLSMGPLSYFHALRPARAQIHSHKIGTPVWLLLNEDKTSTDTHIKIKNKMSLFLYLHNNIIMNLAAFLTKYCQAADEPNVVLWWSCVSRWVLSMMHPCPMS